MAVPCLYSLTSECNWNDLVVQLDSFSHAEVIIEYPFTDKRSWKKFRRERLQQWEIAIGLAESHTHSEIEIREKRPTNHRNLHQVYCNEAPSTKAHTQTIQTFAWAHNTKSRETSWKVVFLFCVTADVCRLHTKVSLQINKYKPFSSCRWSKPALLLVKQT